MAPRQRRNLADVLAETAPEKGVETAPPPATTRGRPVTPIRSTMDLQPDEHARFLKWAVDASTSTGRSVQGQNVLRALVRRLIDDPDLTRQILDDLEHGRGAKHV